MLYDIRYCITPARLCYPSKAALFAKWRRFFKKVTWTKKLNRAYSMISCKREATYRIVNKKKLSSKRIFLHNRAAILIWQNMPAWPVQPFSKAVSRLPECILRKAPYSKSTSDIKAIAPAFYIFQHTISRHCTESFVIQVVCVVKRPVTHWIWVFQQTIKQLYGRRYQLWMKYKKGQLQSLAKKNSSRNPESKLIKIVIIRGWENRMRKKYEAWKDCCQAEPVCTSSTFIKNRHELGR